MPVSGPPKVWLPSSESEREAIRQQVARILASPLFRNSKRFPSLLRYTAEYVLAGNTEHPKERTLGIEVFGRAPDYDTVQDPVVRMTAVEIRRRLAQYYEQPENVNDIRIDFPPGSYVPEFRAPQSNLVVDTAVSPLDPGVWTRRDRRRMAGWVVGGVVICALVLWRVGIYESALDRFWKPVLAPHDPILICVGDMRPVSPEGSTPRIVSGQTTIGDMLRGDTVRYSDALTLSILTGFIGTKRGSYHVRQASSTTLSDLRDGPVILVGLSNNPWTLRFVDSLRFNLVVEADRTYIRDRLNPANRKWGHDGPLTPLAKMPEAYGLISRVLDPATGHSVVMVAGLLWGTRAAGDCLIEPRCMEEAERLAPRDWKGRNIQIIVSAKVLGETSGPPRALAAHVW
jgi:hypothetical protein